jgi:hypothetical protein
LLHDHRASKQGLRCRADDDLVARGGPLQPRRSSHHGPRYGVAKRSCRPGDDDVPRFDTALRPVGHTLELPRTFVQRPDGRLCRGYRAYRSQRIVLVGHGKPEECEQDVPELALDTAAVTLDHLGRYARAKGAEAPECLGVRVGGCRGCDVDNRNRHGPPLPGKPRPW